MNKMNDLSEFLEPSQDNSEPQLVTKSKHYATTDFYDLNQTIDLSKSLTIFNVNSRSLIKHFSEYELYFQSLQSEHFTSFDIIYHLQKHG